MGVIQDMCLNDTHKGREAFSKVKRLLRVIGARTKEALVEAIGKALDVQWVPGRQEASSLTAVTAGWSNIYERCCNSRDSGHHGGLDEMAFSWKRS